MEEETTAHLILSTSCDMRQTFDRQIVDQEIGNCLGFRDVDPFEAKEDHKQQWNLLRITFVKDFCRNCSPLKHDISALTLQCC